MQEEEEEGGVVSGDMLTGFRAVLGLSLVAVGRRGHEAPAPVLVVCVAMHLHAMTCRGRRGCERERERESQHLQAFIMNVYKLFCHL